MCIQSDMLPYPAASKLQPWLENHSIMKRILYALGISLSIIFVACNDNTGSTADEGATDRDTNSTASTGNTNTSTPSTDTTPSQSRTFNDVMNKMMQDMHAMTMTNDADHDFAMMMKEHHEGAIEMSNIELSNGKNDELKQVAQKMISDAQKDNTELTNFLSSHQPTAGQSDFAKKAMDMMMKSSGMNHDSSDTDQQFAMMMAMHHQHGIDMARLYLKSARAEQTKKVANNTIKSNSEDIKKLKAWQ
jgi:uncharacterized protein (DUF305 family)